MKLGLVMPEYSGPAGRGGIATYVYNMANAFAGLGHGVHVLQKDGVAADPLEKSVLLKTFPSPAPGRLERLLFSRFVHPEILHQRRVSRCYRDYFDSEGGFDAVEIPEYNGEAVAFGRARYKVVVRLHTPAFVVDRLNNVSPDRRRRAWYRLEGAALWKADGVLSSSLALKREVCSFYGFPEGRVAVIRYPVDTKGFDPAGDRTPGSGPVVLWAGRLERRKGIETLIRALPGFLKRHGDVRFVLAGGADGSGGRDYGAEVRSAAESAGDRVLILGAVRREALKELYRTSDIFIIPSLFDNSPNSLFEAMASGLACLGSDCGGINEIIRPGGNGLLFRAGDPEAFSEALSTLVTDLPLREKLGAAARETMVKDHCPAAIAGQVLSYIRRL